jgi:membrane dipeptidase
MNQPQPVSPEDRLTRRRFLQASVAASSAVAAGPLTPDQDAIAAEAPPAAADTGGRRAGGPPVAETEIMRLHREAPIFLGYMKPAIRYLPDGGMDASPFFAGPEWSQGCFPRLRKGGVKVTTLSFGLNDPDLFPGRVGVSRVIQSIGAFLQAAAGHPAEIEVARTTADIDRIMAAGKLTVLLHLTGVILEGSLEMLHAYHALGVRCVHPPFDNRADARVDLWLKDAVLTPFDRQVLRELVRLRIVVDLAHASDGMIAEILRLTDVPVIISHGMCRVLSDTKRNLSDDQIRAVAKTGGVIGIHFASQLIDDVYRQRQAASGLHAELRRWEQEMKGKYPDPYQYMANRYDMGTWLKTRGHELEQSIPLPPLGKIADHVDHIVQLVGIDHVGVGTDYDLGCIPQEVDRADKLPNLTRELVRRGYCRSDLMKIWGENFLRVYRQVL